LTAIASAGRRFCSGLKSAGAWAGVTLLDMNASIVGQGLGVGALRGLQLAALLLTHKLAQDNPGEWDDWRKAVFTVSVSGAWCLSAAVDQFLLKPGIEATQSWWSQRHHVPGAPMTPLQSGLARLLISAGTAGLLVAAAHSSPDAALLATLQVIAVDWGLDVRGPTRDAAQTGLCSRRWTLKYTDHQGDPITPWMDKSAAGAENIWQTAQYIIFNFIAGYAANLVVEALADPEADPHSTKEFAKSLFGAFVGSLLPEPMEDLCLRVFHLLAAVKNGYGIEAVRCLQKGRCLPDDCGAKTSLKTSFRTLVLKMITLATSFATLRARPNVQLISGSVAMGIAVALIESLFPKVLGWHSKGEDRRKVILEAAKAAIKVIPDLGERYGGADGLRRAMHEHLQTRALEKRQEAHKSDGGDWQWDNLEVIAELTAWVLTHVHYGDKQGLPSRKAVEDAITRLAKQHLKVEIVVGGDDKKDAGRFPRDPTVELTSLIRPIGDPMKPVQEGKSGGGHDAASEPEEGGDVLRLGDPTRRPYRKGDGFPWGFNSSIQVTAAYSDDADVQWRTIDAGSERPIFPLLGAVWGGHGEYTLRLPQLEFIDRYGRACAPGRKLPPLTAEHERLQPGVTFWMQGAQSGEKTRCQIVDRYQRLVKVLCVGGGDLALFAGNPQACRVESDGQTYYVMDVSVLLDACKNRDSAFDGFTADVSNVSREDKKSGPGAPRDDGKPPLASPERPAPALASDQPAQPRSRTTIGSTIVETMLGDITRLPMKFDIMVNAANERPGLARDFKGVNKAILAASGNDGEDIRRELVQELGHDGRLSIGNPIITGSYALRAKADHVLHAVGVQPSLEVDPSAQQKKVYEGILDAAVGAAKKAGKPVSIVMPTISVGLFGYPVEQAAKELREVMDRLLPHEPYKSSIGRVVICSNVPDMLQWFESRFAAVPASGADGGLPRAGGAGLPESKVRPVAAESAESNSHGRESPNRKSRVIDDEESTVTLHLSPANRLSDALRTGASVPGTPARMADSKSVSPAIDNRGPYSQGRPPPVVSALDFASRLAAASQPYSPERGLGPASLQVGSPVKHGHREGIVVGLRGRNVRVHFNGSPSKATELVPTKELEPLDDSPRMPPDMPGAVSPSAAKNPSERSEP
jgi:O-acetyl-ADP-ribose deacetylase (regulator of RNase III)